ncbi:hypothetical protein LTR01_008906 [Friedmanniomyces endolithicus]|nr:hypothetical protein LTR01_008906 [Friedmanniomyces endolithicus]KAK0822865.1 hypothetical protein LTR73_008981 [Friedmanniomyces endolithicus]
MVQKIAAENQDSVTERTHSEMYGRNDLDDCETHETNDPGLPTPVGEDVHNAVHDALQDDKLSVGPAGTQETTLDVPNGWSRFQSSRKIAAKPQKKSIKTRVAMFDDNALGEQG